MVRLAARWWSTVHFILMDRRRFMRGKTGRGGVRNENRTAPPTPPPKKNARVVPCSFPQQRHVSSTDMKYAVTVSYLNVSLGGKVRQQLSDVLQPA